MFCICVHKEYCSIIFFLIFDTGFPCVTVLAILELALVDQASLELTEICLPPSAEIKGMCHHSLVIIFFFIGHSLCGFGNNGFIKTIR